MVCCDCNRPTLTTIQAAGFTVTKAEHTTLPKAPSFVSPLVVGEARRLDRGERRPVAVAAHHQLVQPVQAVLPAGEPGVAGPDVLDEQQFLVDPRVIAGDAGGQGAAEGAEWTVKMHPPRMPSWLSISRVEKLDRGRFRFVYQTRNADGNPSYTRWAWHVATAGSGAEATVTWDCYLKTLDRRFLAGPLRKRQLAREVRQSLNAMASAVTATGGPIRQPEPEIS